VYKAPIFYLVFFKKPINKKAKNWIIFLTVLLLLCIILKTVQEFFFILPQFKKISNAKLLLFVVQENPNGSFSLKNIFSEIFS
jgi:hypothetical protein